MRVLLTGGAGFIGSHIALLLLERGFDVLILDSFVNSSPIVVDRIKTYLDRNDFVKKWLKERISETKVKKWSLTDKAKPTSKVYSLLYPKKNSNYKKFDCGPKRAGIDFASIRSVSDDFQNLLNSDFLGDSIIKLNKLLLPDLNLGLDDEDFESILSYEGYQLK